MRDARFRVSFGPGGHYEGIGMNLATPDILVAEPLAPRLGPPPPPPPDFVEKTRGKKSTSVAGLALVCENLAKTAARGVTCGGGTLWLRDAGGVWHTSTVSSSAFTVAVTSGTLDLLVTPAIDPIEVLIQPKNESWAQRVELDTLYVAALSSASASP